MQYFGCLCLFVSFKVRKMAPEYEVFQLLLLTYNCARLFYFSRFGCLWINSNFPILSHSSDKNTKTLSMIRIENGVTKIMKKDVAAARTFFWKKKGRGVGEAWKGGVLLASTNYLFCAALAILLALETIQFPLLPPFCWTSSRLWRI